MAIVITERWEEERPDAGAREAGLAAGRMGRARRDRWLRSLCCLAAVVPVACGGGGEPRLTSGAFERVDGLWQTVPTGRIWRPAGERAALVIQCAVSSEGPDPRQSSYQSSTALLQVTREEVPSALIRCVSRGNGYVPDLEQFPALPGWTAWLRYVYNFTYSGAGYDWQLVLSSGSMEGATRYDIPSGPGGGAWPGGTSSVTVSAGGCTLEVGDPPGVGTFPSMGCQAQ